ncbi:MAG: hypothetical protein ACTSV5_13230 [Promethearchaeota archaeon]
MELKGYYYFLNNTNSMFLEDIVLTLLRRSDIGIGLFFLLEDQIRCKDLRVFGVKNGFSYGFTIILNDIKKIDNSLVKEVLKAELLVVPSDINVVEWNEEDRLTKAKYFDDYKEYIDFIHRNE